jgi:medium-chain acyl-[acyl-carrier-protein] hydrolase
VSLFWTWAKILPGFIEVRPVCLPGRESRLNEPAFSQLSTLVNALAPELLNYVNSPFAFYGHSMGALIAFELSRALIDIAGLAPIHVFISASPAPQISRRRAALHTLPDAMLVEELRRLNGTTSEYLDNRELMQLMLPTVRADLELCETYVYKPGRTMDCPISVFGGKQDSSIPHEDLLAWKDHTDSTFTLRLLQGDHFLQKAQDTILNVIAADIQACINA